MSKELEALEDITLYLNANEPKGLYCKNIEILKTALKDYEELDLRVKENNLLIDTFYKVIKKQEQVLKIIKEKEVNITLLIDCIHYPSISGNTNEEKLAYYNRNIFENEKSRLLTQEDFDLLMEYFK